MKYEKTIYVSDIDIMFSEEVMAIENEADPRWEKFESIKDCCVKVFSTTFDNGYFADIKICSGTSNFFIDPVLFNNEGFEACVLDCADALIGDYEFEDREDEYIVHIISRPYNIYRLCYDTKLNAQPYFDNPNIELANKEEALEYAFKLATEEANGLKENIEHGTTVEVVEFKHNDEDGYRVNLCYNGIEETLTELWISNYYEN